MPGTASVSPQQALAVYAEPLAAGRRVVVFGEPDGGVSERLSELGARTVVSVAPGEDPGDLRPATFDLALVPDLGAFDDPAALLTVVRRVVGENGAALVAASTGAIDYYELFDLVAREFVDVRMIAQVPFHGVALAELGTEEESPAVSVDTQLVGESREPEGFVALASQRGASLDPYAIVALPAPAPEAAPIDGAALEAAGAMLAQEQLRAAELEAEADALRAQAAHAIERASQLERELAARARQLSELSSEVEETRAAAEAGRVAAAQVEELARRADRAEQALARAEPELARLTEAHATELGQLEAALRDRAQAIRTLEAEVSRRDRMVHELVGALEEHAAAPPPPFDIAGVPSEPREREREREQERRERQDEALHQRLDALALELARREGEAQAAAWTIAELERRLATVPADRGTHEQQAELTSALDELDALRRALAQEHEQRVRAEAALEARDASDPEKRGQGAGAGQERSPGTRP